MKKTIIALLVGSMLAACTTTQQQQSEPITNKHALPVFSYDITGGNQWGLVQAFKLNNKTYVQFLDIDHANPAFVGLDGEDIPFTKNGMYAVLNKAYDGFIVVSDFGRATVSTRGVAPSPLLAKAAAAQPEGSPTPINSNAAPPMQIKAALAFSLEQLTELAALENRVVGERISLGKTSEIDKRLKAFERSIEQSNLPILHVYFEDNSTVFAPTSDVLDVLVASAQEAERVMIRGFTDARRTTPKARRLASERARNAKQYLVDHGVDAAKIRTGFIPAGGHIAVNTLDEGKSFNRRVDVLLKYPETDLQDKVAASVWNGKVYK